MRKGIKISNDLRAWFINHLATAIDKVVASYDMQREQALAMMTPTFEDFVSGSTNAGCNKCDFYFETAGCPVIGKADEKRALVRAVIDGEITCDDIFEH
tara:strand:- start:279534 stop:279830 length:297 start_codon:yes stop_codon:yes gene_type:complete